MGGGTHVGGSGSAGNAWTRQGIQRENPLRVANVWGQSSNGKKGRKVLLEVAAYGNTSQPAAGKGKEPWVIP